MNKRIPVVPLEALKALKGYSWPGNVRELQNVIERSVILSTGEILEPCLDELKDTLQISVNHSVQQNEGPTTLRDIEREHIIQNLAATNWVIGGPRGAAARLGLGRTTLIAKMKKLGISRAQA